MQWLGNGRIPSFSICQSFHIRNWLETTEAILSEFKSSNSKITVDTDQNFCLTLYSKIDIPGITNQLVDCLSCLDRQKDKIKLSKLQIHQITNWLSARNPDFDMLI